MTALNISGSVSIFIKAVSIPKAAQASWKCADHIIAIIA